MHPERELVARTVDTAHCGAEPNTAPEDQRCRGGRICEPIRPAEDDEDCWWSLLRDTVEPAAIVPRAFVVAGPGAVLVAVDRAGPAGSRHCRAAP